MNKYSILCLDYNYRECPSNCIFAQLESEYEEERRAEIPSPERKSMLNTPVCIYKPWYIETKEKDS